MPRHELDAFSLVAGILCTGVALVALLDHGLDLPPHWALPVLLIAAGLGGLFATAARHRD